MTSPEHTSEYHIGASDYSKHKIQPYDIWEEYQLDPWDADIIKRVLRTKTEKGRSPEEVRIEDYEKIIHVCRKQQERIREGLKDAIKPSKGLRPF